MHVRAVLTCGQRQHVIGWHLQLSRGHQGQAPFATPAALCTVAPAQGQMIHLNVASVAII